VVSHGNALLAKPGVAIVVRGDLRRAELRYFDGFDLVEPGLVPKPQWRPDPGTDAAAPDVDWCGVARLR
jgi:hypothetical protein